jgi:hypothetical protein
MASSISAGTTSSTALVATADTTGALQLATNNGTVALTVDTSQRVGIGTSSPGANLEVKGASGQNIYVSYTSGSQLRLKSDSGDSGIGTTGSTPLLFLISNGEVARFDTSGNLGIGTSSPVRKLTVSFPGAAEFVLQDTSQAANSRNWRVYNASNSLVMGTLNDAGTAGNDYLKINSGGQVLIGATTARSSESKLELRGPASTALSLYMFKDTQVEANIGFKASTDTNFYVGSSGTTVGNAGVYLTNGGNSWNAVSDERMKTIVEPIQNASAKVATLRTVMGYYNADTTQTRRPFLIAQDVQAVLPEAVNVQDVETGTLGMSYTDTIPLLVAAINELTAKVTALEAKVGASA